MEHRLRLDALDTAWAFRANAACAGILGLALLTGGVAWLGLSGPAVEAAARVGGGALMDDN